MTSTYAASDVADSFEDLSSLSSDKDIESLVLATIYNDDDDDELDKNSKSTNTTNTEAEGTATKEDDDDDFVDLVGADVEDGGDVLSECWEFSHSISPEPQDSHRDSTTLLESSQPEKAPTRLLENRSTKKKKGPSATTTAKVVTSNNTNLPLTSSIPKIKKRMMKDILAPLNKPVPSASVVIASSASPNRVVAIPSRLRQPRQKAAKITTTTTATATFPDAVSAPSPQAKKYAEPKKAVAASHQATGALDQTAVPTAIVGPSVPSAIAAAFTITDKTQKQEESDGICKAIRRSTGKRCTRHGQHGGYCSTHRLLVK
ncbi:hypothetical protein BG015_001461 [Linnemannia schmuckeri]|uniref:Uncharacterized protein n=1 Tax=Linnemannia schmuckeri TaxID=64567 RepID=A0A9P5RPR6_9FUNG|nr:hypothetical protein BG015_001461 [Linnemannia schmuckeri]